MRITRYVCYVYSDRTARREWSTECRSRSPMAQPVARALLRDVGTWPLRQARQSEVRRGPEGEDSMRKALAIQHVAFEGLGTLEAALLETGFSVEVRDAACVGLQPSNFLTPDLLIILGGPISVYEERAYPFLEAEIDMVRRRVHGQRPTLGICLGAQIIAAALGARVYPGAKGKEIGWGKLRSAGTGTDGAFGELLKRDPCVLHWHGDTFDLPLGVRLLASTENYANQAFVLGNFALALQFHLEVTAQGLERWYVGHACELTQAKIDVSELRAESHIHGPKLENAARRFWRRWLDETFGTNAAIDPATEEKQALC